MAAEGDGDGLGAIGGADFREDEVQVLLHAVFTDAELMRNVRVGEPAHDRREDLLLQWPLTP